MTASIVLRARSDEIVEDRLNERIRDARIPRSLHKMARHDLGNGVMPVCANRHRELEFVPPDLTKRPEGVETSVDGFTFAIRSARVCSAPCDRKQNLRFNIRLVNMAKIAILGA